MSARQPPVKKIIVTEDDPSIEDVFMQLFEKAGYSVTLIPDGMDLIDKPFDLPDLFIIDKQLSGVNGLDVCTHLKKQPLTKHIPVIMVSASPSIGKLAIAAGADAFMEKPFTKKDILALVAKHMKLG